MEEKFDAIDIVKKILAYDFDPDLLEGYTITKNITWENHEPEDDQLFDN